jgi:hypothetical protein
MRDCLSGSYTEKLSELQSLLALHAPDLAQAAGSIPAGAGGQVEHDAVQ